MCVFLHVKREIDQYSPIRTSPSVNKIYNVLFIFNLYCCDDFEMGNTVILNPLIRVCKQGSHIQALLVFTHIVVTLVASSSFLFHFKDKP